MEPEMVLLAMVQSYGNDLEIIFNRVKDYGLKCQSKIRVFFKSIILAIPFGKDYSEKIPTLFKHYRF